MDEILGTHRAEQLPMWPAQMLMSPAEQLPMWSARVPETTER
jgi:hypothetical protein